MAASAAAEGQSRLADFIRTGRNGDSHGQAMQTRDTRYRGASCRNFGSPASRSPSRGSHTKASNRRVVQGRSRSRPGGQDELVHFRRRAHATRRAESRRPTGDSRMARGRLETNELSMLRHGRRSPGIRSMGFRSWDVFGRGYPLERNTPPRQRQVHKRRATPNGWNVEDCTRNLECRLMSVSGTDELEENKEVTAHSIPPGCDSRAVYEAGC